MWKAEIVRSSVGRRTGEGKFMTAQGGEKSKSSFVYAPKSC